MLRKFFKIVITLVIFLPKDKDTKLEIVGSEENGKGKTEFYYFPSGFGSVRSKCVVLPSPKR